MQTAEWASARLQTSEGLGITGVPVPRTRADLGPGSGDTEVTHKANSSAWLVLGGRKAGSGGQWGRALLLPELQHSHMSTPRTLEATLHGALKPGREEKGSFAQVAGCSSAQCQPHGTCNPRQAQGFQVHTQLQERSMTEGEQGSESDQPDHILWGDTGEWASGTSSVLRNRVPAMCNSQTGASRPGLSKVCS